MHRSMPFKFALNEDSPAIREAGQGNLVGRILTDLPIYGTKT